MAIPVIYKGDDTDFRGSTGFTLKVVTSSNLNLSGCTVEVEVLGYRKSFPASATGELVCPFAFSAAETQRMPLGIHAAIVRVYDSKGRVRTINNSIRVKVTNSVHEAYGKDDPQEVTLAVSTVDLEAYAKKKDIPSLKPYAKKEEVTAAIEKAIKDASASVKLHVLTPEVADTTVTLAPVDGAANHVGGKVAMEGWRVITSREMRAQASTYSGDTSMYFTWGPVPVEILEHTVEPSMGHYLKVRFLEQCNVSGPRTGHIPVGTVISYSDPGDIDYNGSQTVNLEYNYIYGGEFLNNTVWDDPAGLPEYAGYAEIATFIQRGENVPPKSPVVVLPESADTTKARRFSLALETDTDTEKAVEWQGGEVIEAVPGASKLVPGLNVWDVAEVAPGMFRVDRASSPAQSAPLTLTSPGGRVAELAVSDDLVLEVKEI